MSTVPAVYVNQQLPSLIAGDAAQRDVVRPFPVQLTVLNAVCCGLSGHTLRVLLLFRQDALEQVRLELLGLAPLLRFQREEQVGSRARAASWGA